MAKLIGRVRSSNFGENLFITKAQEFLDDHYIIYWNRQIFGREFDVCILMPGKGILVVELKGWREENILRIENSDTIIIKTDEGEIPATPQKQARGYRFAIERHIRQNIGKYPLVFQMVCLPQVSKSFYHQKRLDVVLDEPFTILKEDLEDTNSFYKKIDQALSEANHFIGKGLRLIQKLCWKYAIFLNAILNQMRMMLFLMSKIAQIITMSMTTPDSIFSGPGVLLIACWMK